MIGRTSSAAIAALLLAVSGCGEKGEPATTGPVETTGPTTTPTTTTTGSGQEDRAAAERAASDYLLLAGPQVCVEGITPKLLKAAYGDKAGCIAARKPDSVATQVDLDPVKLSGGTATVTAQAKGGIYGKGERVTMTLLREGDAWLVDTARSNVPVGP